MFLNLKYVLEKGILGLNRRNLDYLFPINERRNYPLVDNKLLTKRLLASLNIPTPQVEMVFTSHRQLNRLEEALVSRESFTIKPAKGTCGRGIVILRKCGENLWIDPRKKIWNAEDLRQHISAVICGVFSLGNQPDMAIIEEKIVPIDFFQSIAPAGLSDIRIIVYKNVAVMAMVRFPTFFSNGRANLFAGGIGAGMNMDSGCILPGVYKNREITIHPDTALPFTGFNVPHWQEIKLNAVRVCQATGMGFLAVDAAIEKNRGVMIMEINARPGLDIQKVNSAGLLPRLRAIDCL